jgi:hypothetical protein
MKIIKLLGLWNENYEPNMKRKGLWNEDSETILKRNWF